MRLKIIYQELNVNGSLYQDVPLGSVQFGKGALVHLRWGLRKILGRSPVSYDELSELNTLVIELEAIANDRPLTYVSGELIELEAITPSHLIDGHQIIPLPLLVEKDNLDDPGFQPDNIISEANKRY